MALQVYGAPLPAGADTFTRLRRTGLGGSDAGAVLGVSPWASRLSLWEEKRGLAPRRSEPNEVMLWGTRLEHAIRRGYVEDTGIAVTKPEKMLRHPDMPWVIGHVDGLTAPGPNARILEVKTAQRLDEQWGPPGTADIPMHYMTQVQHYMALTGYLLCDLAVLVQGRRMDIYRVPYDRTLADAMLADEQDFWENNVVGGVAPEPDGSESAGAVLRRMFPQAVVDEALPTPEMNLAAEAYLAARDVRDHGEQEMAQQAQRMQLFMGAKGRMAVPGATVLWGNRAGSTLWKGLAASYRDLLVPHYTDDALDGIAARHAGEATRTFSVTKKVRRDV